MKMLEFKNRIHRIIPAVMRLTTIVNSPLMTPAVVYRLPSPVI